MTVTWRQTLAVFVACAGLAIHVTTASAAGLSLSVVLTTPQNEILYANISSVPLKLGFFAQEHLDVRFAFVPGGNAGAQIVAAGGADMYFGPPLPVFKSPLIGANLKIVYVMNHGQQYYPVVLATSPIKKLDELRGKRLGVLSLAMGGIPYYKAELEAAGVDPEDVSFIPIGAGAQALAALTSGTVDGLALWDTQIASMENLGYHFRAFLPPEREVDVSSSLVTTESVIARKPAAIKAYLRAVAKATVFCLKNEAACVEMHWKVFPETRPQGGGSRAQLDAAVHVLATRYKLYDITRYGISLWGDTSDQQLEAAASFMVKWGQLKAIQPPSQYIDRQFLRYANGFDAEAIRTKAKEWSAPAQ